MKKDFNTVVADSALTGNKEQKHSKSPDNKEYQMCSLSLFCTGQFFP